MNNNSDCAGCYEAPCICKSKAKTARKKERKARLKATSLAMIPLPLAEVRDVLLCAGHRQALWSGRRQWTGGFACKQTTLNEAEVTVYHVWGADETPLPSIAGLPNAEMPALLAYQGALIRAGYATALLSAAPNPLLLVSRSAEQTAWAEPWRIDVDGRGAAGRGPVDEVSGVGVG